jgi:uncharacterized phage protein (TIGR01671 family)
MSVKFRAWLRAEKRMYPVAYIHWEGGNIVEIGLEGLTEDDNGYEVYDVVEPKDCDLMQSTGFQYNDGKDIFEGDIVRLGYGIPPTSADLVIEWTTTETIDDVPVCGWWMRNLDPKGTSSMMSDLYDLEKIGNRYANPELLRAEEMEGKR